jgi:hypothetical protein
MPGRWTMVGITPPGAMRLHGSRCQAKGQEPLSGVTAAGGRLSTRYRHNTIGEVE